MVLQRIGLMVIINVIFTFFSFLVLKLVGGAATLGRLANFSGGAATLGRLAIVRLEPGRIFASLDPGFSMAWVYTQLFLDNFL